MDLFSYLSIFRCWYKKYFYFCFRALLHFVIDQQRLIDDKLRAGYAEFKDELDVEKDPRKHVRFFCIFEVEE